MADLLEDKLILNDNLMEDFDIHCYKTERSETAAMADLLD